MKTDFSPNFMETICIDIFYYHMYTYIYILYYDYIYMYKKKERIGLISCKCSFSTKPTVGVTDMYMFLRRNLYFQLN